MNPIRIRGVAEMAVTLPYQLGYHLQDCLVVVALHRGAMGMIQRIDLPPPPLAGSTACQLAGSLRREDPDAVLLVAYERARGCAQPLLEAMAARLADDGIEVTERLVVRDNRLYAHDRPDIPEEGLVLPEAAGIPAVADFVALEVAPLPSRASLEAVVAADATGSEQVRVALARPAPARAGQALGVSGSRGGLGAGDPHRQAVERLARLSLWSRACDVSVTARPVDELSPDDVATLVRSLEDRALRDGVIARLCPRTLPLEALDEDLADALRATIPDPTWDACTGGGRTAALAAHRLLARLQWLARSVPDEHCAGLLTVLASVAWWMGEGSLARVAVERALSSAPDYTLARLLEQMIDHGVRPARADEAGTSRALSA